MAVAWLSGGTVTCWDELMMMVIRRRQHSMQMDDCSGLMHDVF